MTHNTKVLDRLALAKTASISGIHAGLAIFREVAAYYERDLELFDGAGSNGRVQYLKTMQTALAGIIASDAQLALTFVFEKADHNGDFDTTEEEDARDAVVSAACALTDVRSFNCAREETLEELAQNLDAAVLDFEEVDSDEERPHTVIDLDPEPNGVELQDLIKYLNSL